MRTFVVSLPDSVGAEFDQAAEYLHCTSIEVIQKFVKLGLTAIAIEKDPNSRLIVEDENGQREITLLPEA